MRGLLLFVCVYIYAHAHARTHAHAHAPTYARTHQPIAGSFATNYNGDGDGDGDGGRLGLHLSKKARLRWTRWQVRCAWSPSGASLEEHRFGDAATIASSHGV